MFCFGAYLSNGQLYVGNDLKAWLDLQQRVQLEGVKITSLSVSTDERNVSTTDNAEGYFLGVGAMAVPGGPTVNTLLLGHLDKCKIYINKYILPQLHLYEQVCRDNLNDPRLITNP